MQPEQKQNSNQPDGNNKKQQNNLNADELQKQRVLHQQQQKVILKQIQQQSPLIGESFEFGTLMDQFIQNQGFYLKVQNLITIYKRYRKTRRDGSCFYRAFNYSIFEKIVENKNKKLQQHMIERIKSAKQHLLQAKFEGIIFEDLQDMFIQKLDKKLPKDLEQVLKMFRDPEDSNYLVLMLRFITSAQIRNNAIIYQTFIDNQIPVELFCQIQVQPIDKEADQITIMALLNYLQVAIKIVYLDSSKNQQAYTVILPESAKQEQVIATLLYRPGHYDILYK